MPRIEPGAIGFKASMLSIVLCIQPVILLIRINIFLKARWSYFFRHILSALKIFPRITALGKATTLCHRGTLKKLLAGSEGTYLSFLASLFPWYAWRCLRLCLELTLEVGQAYFFRAWAELKTLSLEPREARACRNILQYILSLSFILIKHWLEPTLSFVD